MSNIYTIGCSVHTQDELLTLLKRYNIDAVADVRSVPYSKHTPQFNKELLNTSLKKSTIHYLSFSEEFGARRKEKEAYTNGKVDFEKVIKLSVFLQGVDRLENGIEKGFNTALLCTEKNPLDCHRFLLVSKALYSILNVDIKHILYDGSIRNQKEIEKQMLANLHMESDLFVDENTRIEKAYNLFSEKILFSEEAKII